MHTLDSDVGATPGPASEGERGFTLLDLMVGVMILSSILFVMMTTAGRPPSAHPAALALQAALVEARSIASMQQADDTDTGLPTGATVSIAYDAAKHTSMISVYRSRPIPNANMSIYGAKVQTLALPRDVGFPPQVVPAMFTISQVASAGVAGGSYSGGDFTIMIASSGYTSIKTAYSYGPGVAILTPPDPGCSDAGVTITAASPIGGTEAHPFDCRNAVYNASVMI